ncbi:hypothetical protein JX266_013600 [Neoarthrinium moseri]|nr:hypothetical protein JX266_013600 [Neoarthrinium moseri]
MSTSDMTDGELYRLIRQSQLQGNPGIESECRSRLSKHKLRCLSQLLKHQSLREAFGRLLDIPGLWHGMRISTINKHIGMKCDEKLVCYLDYVANIWSRILRGSSVGKGNINTAIVQALELTCPKYSSADRRRLEIQLEKGQVLQNFSYRDRELIYQNLVSIDCVIPSLKSFLEDTKYLQPCADNIRHVVGLLGCGRTTNYAALQACFLWDDAHVNQIVVERSESVFETRGISPEARFEANRQQLWLWAMRHFAQLAPPSKGLTAGLANVGPERANDSLLCRFAYFAYRLGFRNDRILQWKQRSPDRELARSVLLKARKPDMYEYDNRSFDLYLDQIEEIMQTARPLLNQQRDRRSPWHDGVETGNRCGYPASDDHQLDKKHLFLDTITQDNAPIQGVTSFFVRRCVFTAFLVKNDRYTVSSNSNYAQIHDVEGQMNDSSGRIPLAELIRSGREMSGTDHEVDDTPATEVGGIQEQLPQSWQPEDQGDDGWEDIQESEWEELPVARLHTAPRHNASCSLPRALDRVANARVAPVFVSLW